MQSFYREIDKSGALILQAATESQSPNIEKDYPIDCDTSLMKTRLRVSSLYDHSSYSISKGGTNASLVPFGMETRKYYSSSKCTDVYVSWGKNHRWQAQYPLYITGSGLNFVESTFSCSSFITPVLSAFVAEKQSSGEWKGLKAEEQKALLMGNFQSVALHPLKYRQFEAYRLKILE